MSAIAPQDLAAVIPRCQEDPAFFFREVLGDEPTEKQVEIAESVRDNRTTAVPSCHASGKSWDAARIVLWFLYCFYGAKCITTAPTSRQVESILWSEIGAAMAKARYPLGGHPTSLRILIEADWYAMGFTAPDWDPNRFQGFHAPHVLVVEDEAAGISKQIADQIDSLMTGPHPRRLKIGNPVEAGTPFQASCEAKSVSTIPISAYDTPNFTAFGITEKDMRSGRWRKKVKGREMPYPFLIDPHWVADRVELWGFDSAAYKSRVKAIFPDEVAGAYYASWVKRARDDGRIGIYRHDHERPVVTFWDIGVSDWTTVWFVQMHGTEPWVIDFFQCNGEGVNFYLDVLDEKREKLEYRYRDHIAPHDFRKREFAADAKTAYDVAQRRGYRFRCLPRTNFKQGSEVQNRIEVGRSLLEKACFHEETTKEGLDALSQYRQKMDIRTGHMMGVPEHDWTSHAADAWGYGAIGLRVKPQTSRPAQPVRRRT